MTGKTLAPDYWTHCGCGDVHHESERIHKPTWFCKSMTVSTCPRCGSSTQEPRAKLPRQRDLFEGGRATC